MKKKKLLLAAVVALCAVVFTAWANGSLYGAMNSLLPEDALRGLGLPVKTIRIGGKELRYDRVQRYDHSDSMKVQNGSIAYTCYLYTDGDGNVYIVDKSYRLRTFLQMTSDWKEAPEQETAPGQAELAAAIAGAESLGLTLTESQLAAANRIEYGYAFIFRWGSDPRIQDEATVYLDWDLELSKLYLDSSGIGSMEEVDQDWFDDAFASYCEKNGLQPREVTVDYRRYGDCILARYSMAFEDEPPPGYENGARWVDMVSFLDKRES